MFLIKIVTIKNLLWWVQTMAICHGLLPAAESIVGTDVRCLNGFGTALETIDQLIRARNYPVKFSKMIKEK